jgi:hypothetical protein
MPKKVKTAEAPGSSKAITIHLKSSRNPVLDIELSKVPLSTSTVQDLKEAVQQRTKPSSAANADENVPLDKIKILWKRKPVQAKTVSEILADEPGLLAGGGHVEFGVMILGGATALSAEEIQATTQTEPPKPQSTQTAEDTTMDIDADVEPEARGPSVNAVLGESAFWDELEGFLKTKINDGNEAARLRLLFRDAWDSSR